MSEPPHYPMTNLSAAKHSLALVERDYRAGILDDFQYAEMRQMLREAITQLESADIKRTSGAEGLRYTDPNVDKAS